MKKLILIAGLLLVVGCEPKYDNKAELFPEKIIYETGYPGLIVKHVKCDLRSDPDGYSYKVLMFALTHRAPDAEVTQSGDPQAWNEIEEGLDILFPEGVDGYIKVQIRDAAGDVIQRGSTSFGTIEPGDGESQEVQGLDYCSRSDITFMFSYSKERPNQ